MNLNLYIKVDGVKLELCPTPTYITLMCLAPNYKGKVSTSRAINAYLAYVKGTLNRLFESAEEAEEARRKVNEHIEAVLSAIDVAKKVRVFAVNAAP